MVLSPGAGRASAAGGGACLLCRLPTMPLACLFAPYPPDPLPRRGRGSPRLFHARGCAPCIPGVEPGRHRSRGRIARWRSGLPSLSPAYPAFSLLSCPLSPQPPSPAGKGETQSLFRRGRSPRHPGTEPLAVLTEPTKQVPSGGELARRCRLPPPPSPAGGGLPRRFSFHALTGAAGCDILVYRTEPPRRTARKQKETPYRTAIPERRKGENRA